jgi:hypothetical protein
MVIKKYATDAERDKHWQKILDEYSDNYGSELSTEMSKETGVKLKNNEVKASGKELFNPERAKLIFNHIFKIIEG